MKLVSFRRDVRGSFGAVVDGGVVDLTARLGGRDASLKAALHGGALEALRARVLSSEPDLALDGIELQPVIPNAGKIICVGLNYAPHIAESGRDIPHITGQPLVRPRVSERFDFDGGADRRPGGLDLGLMPLTADRKPRPRSLIRAGRARWRA